MCPPSPSQDDQPKKVGDSVTGTWIGVIKNKRRGREREREREGERERKREKERKRRREEKKRKEKEEKEKRGGGDSFLHLLPSLLSFTLTFFLLIQLLTLNAKSYAMIALRP